MNEAWRQYEALKAGLQAQNLTPEEYDRKLRELLEALRL